MEVKMEHQPLVSIIMPNYNHSMYLEQSIQSALNQTYSNIEVIVNDNASSDNSLGTIFCREESHCDNSVKYFP